MEFKMKDLWDFSRTVILNWEAIPAPGDIWPLLGRGQRKGQPQTANYSRKVNSAATGKPSSGV